MFYIIIGQSGAGKTTFVRNRFLKEPYTIEKDGIYYTQCENGTVLLGKYGIDKRTQGTDTLSYSAKEKIKTALQKFAAENKDVVLEGDRINNDDVFRFISRLGVETKLYLVNCSLATSMKRLRSAGSTITPTFVKTTKTKSKNMFLKWGKRFHGEIINTEPPKEADTPQ